MEGRIRSAEDVECLKGYLRCDSLTKADEKVKEIVSNWRNEVDEMSSSEDDSDGEHSKKNESDGRSSSSATSKDDEGLEHKSSSNEEHDADSDFIIEDEVIIFADDLPQALKG